MAAKAHAEWQGGLKTGSGSFVAGDAINGAFSFKTRFEDEPGANPEQLLAAAHAACYSMAISAVLEAGGTPVDSINTDASVSLRFIDGAPTVTAVAISVTGKVSGLDADGFQKAAEEAKRNCVISRALSDSIEITLEATLA
jgi:osmotically inducible protein OsmC